MILPHLLSGGNVLPERLQLFIIYTVVVVFLLNFAADLMPFLEYESKESINGIFLGIVGTALAVGKREKEKVDS